MSSHPVAQVTAILGSFVTLVWLAEPVFWKCWRYSSSSAQQVNRNGEFHRKRRDGVDLGMMVPRVFTSTRLSHRILPLCKIPPFDPYYLFYCVSYIHIFSPLLDVNSLRTEFSFSSLAVSVTCRPLAVPHPHPTGCLAPVGGVWNGRWK